MNWPEDFVNKIHCADSFEFMKLIPDGVIDMFITSPPYWGLRDYGVEQIFNGDPGCKHNWGFSQVEHDNLRYRGHNANVGSNKNPEIHKGKKKSGGQFCCSCGAWRGQIGLEPTPEMYIEHLTEIFNEVKRVLKKEGVFFLNMGDTYATTSGRQGKGDLYGKQPKFSKDADNSMPIQYKIDLAQKCLCMIPERLAWSLIQNGWIFRNKIIWEKKNNLPCSAKDRFTNRWEYIFYFVKSRRNYFNLDSVREPLKTTSLERMKRGRGESQRYALFSQYGGGGGLNKPRLNIKFNYRVKGAEKKGKEGPMFKASKEEIEKYQNQDTAECNSRGKNPGDVWIMPTACFPYDYCITCKRLLIRNELIFKAKKRYCPACKKQTMSHFSTFPTELCAKTILPGCPEGGIVLDPFAGAGTALFVAKQLRRKFIGIDIKKEYCEMSEKRLAQGVL